MPAANAARWSRSAACVFQISEKISATMDIISMAVPVLPTKCTGNGP